MMNETRGTSEGGHSKGSFPPIGSGGRRGVSEVKPIVGPSKPERSPEPLRPGPVRRRSDSPLPAKEPSDTPPPVKPLSDFQLEQIGLVGTKVSALLIPANRSQPITDTKFDRDRIWQYDAVSYDRDRVFLTKKHAYLDHGWNPHATEYVKHYSDVAKDPDSRLPIPAKLYGEVIVLSRDWVLEWITDSTKQLNELKHALEWRHPFRGSDPSGAVG